MLSCFVVDSNAENRQEMAQFLTAQQVQVAGQLPSTEMLGAALDRGDPPHLVVVNLDPDAAATLKALTPLIHQHPAVAFFVLSEMLDSSLLMDAIHAGVREFLPLPLQPEKFTAGLERLAQLAGVGKKARLIQVVPSIGGCGATTIACNVGTALARGGRTILVDLDAARGAVASSFDVRPRYTVADLMDPSQKLDAQLLENATILHEPSGVTILGRPEHLEDAGRITPNGINRLLGVLSAGYDYVVVDTVMSMDAAHLAVSRAAEMILIVIQQSVPSVKNAERYLGALRRGGIDLQRVRLVINRFHKRGELAPEMAEKTLNMKISWMVPNDFHSAIAAVNLGQPLVLRSPRAAVSQALAGLAGMLNGKA